MREKNKKIIILEYHRITDTPEEFFSLGAGSSRISQVQFESQVRFLIRHFSVVSLEWFARQISEEKDKDIPERSVAITFDDGYKDAYDNAFPVLKKYDIPATIFLVSDTIGSHKLMWQNLLYYIVYNADIESLEEHLPALAGGELGEPRREPDAGCRERKIALIQRMKFWINQRIPYEKRVEYVRGLADKLNIVDEAKAAKNLYLSEEQIKEMKMHNIDFGAHTKTHPLLSTIPLKDAEEEIIGSKYAIEHLVGKKVFSFAYPFGEDCSMTPIKQILEKAGFLCACTSRFGVNRLEGDLFSLRRKGRSYANISIFAAEMLGIYDLFRKLSRYQRTTGYAYGEW